MGTIIETLYGYEWEEVMGSTPITYEALMSGEIDIYSEIWTDNLASYENDVATGRFELLGMNFYDNNQGVMFLVMSLKEIQNVELNLWLLTYVMYLTYLSTGKCSEMKKIHPKVVCMEEFLDGRLMRF
jgi:hypothetical protein